MEKYIKLEERQSQVFTSVVSWRLFTYNFLSRKT